MAKKPKKGAARGPTDAQGASNDEGLEAEDFEMGEEAVTSAEEPPTDKVEEAHPSLVERVLDKVGLGHHATPSTAEKLEKISHSKKPEGQTPKAGDAKGLTKVPGKHRKFL